MTTPKSLRRNADDHSQPVGDDSGAKTRGRRRFLFGAATAGLTAVGARAIPVWAAAGDGATVAVWRLAGAETLTCRACAAHSTNKVYFDSAAAEIGRAHVGCRCVPESFLIGANEAVRLRVYSRDGGRSVDLRWSSR
jgi:hypothetical protein